MLGYALLSCLLAACAGPIRVDRVSPERVHDELTESVLSRGTLSEGTRNLLRQANLLELFRQDPVLALATGHELMLNRSDRARLNQSGSHAYVALAEASFLHASRRDDPTYYLLSAVYAWAALFADEEPMDPIDPRVRLAANLYNRGLTLAVLPDDVSEGVVLQGGELELPIGVLEIRVDPAEFEWGDRRLADFTPVADLRIHGLNNRYRVSGIGAPFAASTRLADGDAGASAPSLGIHDQTRVPVSVVLVIDDVLGGMRSGRIVGRLEVHRFATDRRVEVGGRDYPAELEPSASLALMLAEIEPWRNEIRRLFEGDLESERDGLKALSLHRAGRIPVVLVHGTASSPATWANMLNDLMADPRIQSRYEFWLFSYNSGAPILYSASLLRNALDELVREIDPEGRDPALRRAVVIGHSQGGLLTKLLAVDSGDLFWRQISDRPLDELEMRPETRALVEDALLVEPSPWVERVVFIATPHRGSFLLTYGASNLLRNMVQAPSSVVRASADLVSRNPQAAALRRIDDTEGALGQMNPNSDFLSNLGKLPIAPGISAHSIIAMRRFVDKEDATDGVVEYQSAHLDGVDSEVVVESGHSCLAQPLVIEETRRILLMHLAARPR